jgi:hypothetical protein
MHAPAARAASVRLQGDGLAVVVAAGDLLEVRSLRTTARSCWRRPTRSLAVDVRNYPGLR